MVVVPVGEPGGVTCWSSPGDVAEAAAASTVGVGGSALVLATGPSL